MIDLRIEGALASIMIRNEARRNAITTSMLSALDEALNQIECRRNVLVLLLKAEGERCFSAGGDVREWGALGPDRMGREWIRVGNRVFRRLAELDAVVICLLQGDALGGGLELALAADIRLAAREARLGFPEVGIGAIPSWLGCARLEALSGAGRARQMILTGLSIDSETAERWGVVNEVWPRERLHPRADELAQAVMSRSPVALRAAKRLLNLTCDVDRFAPAHELAATVCRASSDAAEGLASFHEKRAPFYRGSEG